jgi:hypothetical protein
MHGVYKNIIQRCLNDLKKSQEAQNIWENELPGDSIERTLKIPGNSIGKIQKSQEDIYYDSSQEFISCCDVPFPSPPIPSMALQDSTKGRVIQRRRRFHRTPLNLPEVDFQMPDIPIEKFSTFFGNTSEDAEQHLFRFKCTCDIFNLTEDNVTCRLFLQTLVRGCS